MEDTVHIPYIVDRLDEIIDLYEDGDDALSAVEELRRELIFNMGVNALSRKNDHNKEIKPYPSSSALVRGHIEGSSDTDNSRSNPVIKLRGVPDDSSKNDQIIKLLKAAGSGDAKKINKEIAEKVGCSLQHIYYCKRMLRGGVPND